MQALDFLHCDHVIKIQCRKSTPCRISFAAVCDLVTFHPCLCKSCIREIFLSSINKNKKYWCFVLPWFSMSMEIEAHQQSSLQWGYKVSWLSICWTWIPHLQNSKVRRRPVWVVLRKNRTTQMRLVRPRRGRPPKMYLLEFKPGPQGLQRYLIRSLQ